jgi:hypothetical protein
LLSFPRKRESRIFVVYPDNRTIVSYLLKLLLEVFFKLLKLTDSRHPECSEGSQCCQFYSNATVNYAPAAFRFFASLRFAQNDIFIQVLVKQELVSKRARKSVSLNKKI